MSADNVYPSTRSEPIRPTPSRVSKEVKSSTQIVNDIIQRSVGLPKRKMGRSDTLISKLYHSFDAVDYNSWQKHRFKRDWGGIFNLEFSLNGKMVVAACEGNQILVFDAGNHRQIKELERAHDSCVNCVRFLNDNSFATSSDDNSIKIWDIRKLKSAERSLYGHTNWVKNIEWSESEKVLVTSAFDGTIYAWNLTNMREHQFPFDKVFLMNGLMRMKITPDGTKMIISTTGGYMIIIHNLNLMTLATDLSSFRPNLYRLMQISDQSFPVGTIFNYLFSPTRSRNRIEFIDDFPNEAEVISSLQIHPHGWNAVSRNLNGPEDEEWTAVHDIQDRDTEDYENAYQLTEMDEAEEVDEPEDSNIRRPTDLWMGYISLNNLNNASRSRSHMWEHFQIPTMGIVNSGLIGWNASYNTYFQQHPEERNKVIQNLPRMTHFKKEKNTGKGFIKELCYSSDGRIIGSPYDKGVRLLAFNDDCHELSYCVPERPTELKCIVEMNEYHRDTVVSCKFNPVNYQMVSGCLGSEIKWYQPVL